MPRGVYDRKKAKAKRGYRGHRGKDAPAPKRRYERKRKRAGSIEVTITHREADALKMLVSQLHVVDEPPPRQSAFGRAMLLEVGEEDVMPHCTVHALRMRLAAADRGGLLDGREFVARVAPFSPGVGLAAIPVLWFKRVK